MDTLPSTTRLRVESPFTIYIDQQLLGADVPSNGIPGALALIIAACAKVDI